MNYKIAVIRGDGIGPEVAGAAIRVLEAVGKLENITYTFEEAPVGGNAYDRFGTPLPQSSVDTCLACDTVLLGAVGGPKWDTLPGDVRPEKGLLGIRKALGLYANLRPALLYPELADASPLKPALVENGIDFVVVRELTGGLYYGARGGDEKGTFDTMSYSKAEIERVVRIGFDLAQSRRKKLCSIDKANVLDCSRLWRKTVAEISAEYPEVEVTNMLVDNAAMQLVKNPAQFDVIVTENMFGDILSDEAAQITGSIGMLPSASMGEGKRGLFEPIHGSAPDIAGKNLANPLGTILSAAMLLRLSLGEEKAACRIEKAVKAVLAQGLRTADIAGGEGFIGTEQMTDAVIENL